MSTTEKPPDHVAADTLVARPSLRSLAEDLHERREKAKLGGGPDRIERQHEQDKLTARERLALLIDEGTFTEMGIHGRPHFSVRSMEGKDAPADGVITGYGDVDGRLVAVCAYDFTVMAGSMGMTGELKVGRLRELALTKRIKQYLSFMPQHCEAPLPLRAGGHGSDPIDRMDEELLDVLPESNRKPYDMYEVIRRVVDDGFYFDMKPQWAKTIITCFARFAGRPVGLVAHQPKQLGGIRDTDSADKPARPADRRDAFP